MSICLKCSVLRQAGVGGNCQLTFTLPKSDSALQIQVYDQPLFAADTKKLFRLKGCHEKRKMLRNALRPAINAEQAVI
jgi:hypothetical protein